jgi:muramoyltetrapeptide carboxypeptidase
VTRPVTTSPTLRAGDTVAVVSPSGPILSTDRLEAGIAVLASWGLRPVVLPHVHAFHGHLAGTDEHRAGDLNTAIRDPEIRAIFAARGGYGATRILDLIDWDALADDPIPIVGFSDVTALLVAAWRRLRLVTIHGPSVCSLGSLESEAADHLRGLLFEIGTATTIADGRGLVPGRAEGRIVGGNLSILTSLLGTPDALETEDTILFLEDVGEAPYRIDRMLTQLRRSRTLDRVAGIAVGHFTRCNMPEDRPSLTVEEVLADVLAPLGVPVAIGLPTGHVRNHRAFPHGAEVILDAGAGTVDTGPGAQS